jgi:hypothetical protein
MACFGNSIRKLNYQNLLLINLQAYSASYHDDRIKLTMLFNSGVVNEEKVYLLKELKAPVGYFIGGPLDIAYNNVSLPLYPFSCAILPLLQTD